MPDNTPFDPWDSLADSLGAKPADNPPPPSRPAPPPPPRAREKPPAAKKPQSRPEAGNWDDLADSLGIAPPARDESVARRAPPSPLRPEPAPPRDIGQERRSSEPQPPAARSSWDEELPPRRPVGEAAAERPVRGAREGDSEARGEGEARGRRRRGRRGGRGRRRDDDRPLDSAGEAGSFDREADDDRSRESGAFDRDRERTGEEREPRPARRADEPRPRTRSRDEETVREGRRRPVGEEGFDRSGDDDERDQPQAEFDDLEERGRSGDEADGPDDDRRPRKRRRRGRRGGRGRSRSASETPLGSDADREPGSADADDEPLPASYGSRAAARPESGPRTDDSRRGPDDRPPAEGSASESGRTRGRRRRRRGEPRTGTDAQRKSGTGERRESSRSRSGESRRGRSSESRSSRSRGRRDDFAPVSGRFDEDDEGLEFLGVEEAVRESAPRSRPAEDDDVLAESGLNTVLDVPSWVEAIGIVIAGNLTARSSRSGRGEGGGGPARGR